MKNAFFLDVAPYRSCKNRRFGRTYRLYHQGEKFHGARNDVGSNYQLVHAAKNFNEFQLQVTANVVPSSPIFSP
jgi:hypothetical protein